MKENSKQVALERIHSLFQRARDTIHDRPELAQRYVEIARKIAMRTRIHMPQEYRLQICRQCKRFIFPGITSRVRLKQRREPHIVVTCLYCDKHMRIPLGRKNKK